MKTIKNFLPLIMIITFAFLFTLNLAKHTVKAKQGISAYLLGK